MCSYGRGFIWKYDQREGLTCRRAKGGGALYRIEERGRGFWQSCYSLPPSSTGNRGMGQRRRRWPIPAAWASGAVRMRGQRGRGCGGPIPGRSSARGGLATAAGGYGRRMALGRRCRARRRLGSGGGALGDSGGSISPAHLGLAWSREAGSREAGAVVEQSCGDGAGAWEEARLVVVAVAGFGGGAGASL